jgi:DDE superfamily endonuclease
MIRRASASVAAVWRVRLGRCDWSWCWLIEAGHWREGDPAILVIFDAGYDVTRLSFLLADLPAQVLGRLRSDRVMRLPAPPREPGTVGRPRKHGGELALAGPATWPAPQTVTTTLTSRYGTAVTAAWDRVHPRLTHRAAWLDHHGPLPVIKGTLIRLQVDHLPGDRNPKPVWLWWSRTGALPHDVDRLWQAFLRRFDPGYTFRLFKQVLGWTAPKIRNPQAADRWTWLIITCHAQLRLARPLADDLRLPWERPPRRGGSPPPGSAADSGTSTPPCPAWPVHQTRQARPRTAPRVEEPPSRTPLRRGETTRRERTLTARRERTG